MLDHEFRCITPELPFGAHPTPMRPDADLTTAGLGRLVADFLLALTCARSSWSAMTAAAPSPGSSPPATPTG
jgi:hypothetical protein